MRSPTRQGNSADYCEQTEIVSDLTHICCHAADCQHLKETIFFGQIRSCAVMLRAAVVDNDDDVIAKNSNKVRRNELGQHTE